MRRSVRSASLRLSLVCIVAAASGQQLEFSHRLHLGKVGLSCTFCHGPAESSGAAADSNLPPSQLCLACHNGQTAPNVDVTPLQGGAPAERGYLFSHQQHLALGNPAPRIAEAIDSGKYLGRAGDIRQFLETENACMACHRGLPAADQADSKIHLPRMSDCLVCHDAIDNPFSCETCHPRDFAIKPASHTRNFIDQHSTGKMGFDKLTCQPCHGRSFTCMGCH